MESDRLDSEAGVKPGLAKRYLSESGSAHYLHKYRRPRKRLAHRTESRILRRLLRQVGRSKSLFDVPCGTGRFFPVLRKQADEVHLGDYSPQMLRIAREITRGEAASYSTLNLMHARDNGWHMEGVVSIRLMHHLYGRAARETYLDALAHIAERWIILSFRDALAPNTILRRLKRRIAGKADLCAQRLSAIRHAMARRGFRLVRAASLSALFSGHRYALFVRDDGA